MVVVVVLTNPSDSISTEASGSASPPTQQATASAPGEQTGELTDEVTAASEAGSGKPAENRRKRAEQDAAPRSDAGAAAIANAEVSEDTDVSSLSVAPLGHQIYPEDRPAWIVEEPVLEGSVHRWPVVSVPSLTRGSSRKDLQRQTRAAVDAYVAQMLDDPTAADRIHFSDEHIEMKLVNPLRRYEGKVVVSDGEMFEDAVELEFDKAFRSAVKEQYRDVVLERRLASVGVLGGGAFFLIAGLSGLTKLLNRIRQVKRPVA